MKAAALLTLALVSTLSSFGQYSARTLTRRITPQQPQQQRPQAPRAAPQRAVPAPAPAPVQQPVYRPVIVPQAVAARPAAPVDSAKVAAEKAKNEAKQLDFYKRRAEEGSDHAQFELGMRYLTGKGTEPNEKLAREWLAKSAKQGYPQAKKKLEELGPAAASAGAELKPAERHVVSAPSVKSK